MFNFKITYQKGLENRRADTLSQQTKYLEYKVKRERAIFKEEGNRLVYNHELIIISIIESKL